MKRRIPDDRAKEHAFGGDWTTEKLKVLAGYLRAYTNALKAQPFQLEYIDAFAGTGYRTADPATAGPLFQDLTEADSQGFLDGSARLALKTKPRFHRYIFIERDPARCARLERLKEEFPPLAMDIEICAEEANAKIRELCKRDWIRCRAVLFLDPYGMQVEWTTIEAIAATRAIDMWILFPLGMAVNRLLTRSGDIPPSWEARLDALFGASTWRDELYRKESGSNLFGDVDDRVVKAGTGIIGRYFVDRLKTLFPGVADTPRILCNSRNSPLYLFCFAAGNPRGAELALKIANHLLRKRAI